MFDTPQKIKLVFEERQHWFEVHRFDTPKELHTALLQADIRDFPKETVAYSKTYPQGTECGRMYILDKSIRALASMAADMAGGILARHGYKSMELSTSDATGVEAKYRELIGEITSKLYGQSKFY